MENIRGQTRTQTERIKVETEAVGTVIGWQNVEILETTDQEKDKDH
jgi:hypothetical protein